jgi:hypothetical protein
MNKLKSLNIPKYINKLKETKLPAYIYGQTNALAMKEIYNPLLNRTPQFPKELQICEFYGKMKDDHSYMSDQYKHLLLSLRDGDASYSQTNNLETRVQIAKDQISAWNDFAQKERENLPADEYSIKKEVEQNLREIWNRTKVRMFRLKINLEKKQRRDGV